MTLSTLAGASEIARDREFAQAKDRNAYPFLKRLVDVLVCVTSAPAVFIVIAITMVLVLAIMGRPIFFSQDRVGLNGRRFKMHKLRSMRQVTDQKALTRATVVGDPRITRLGFFLRRTHIDELPQFWNIFRGDMTLIGPRPEQPKLVENYRSVLPDYDRRHSVTPGLSGWAQVRYGYAADIMETKEKLKYDLHYVDNLGPLIDLQIVALTVKNFANTKYVR